MRDFKHATFDHEVLRVYDNMAFCGFFTNITEEWLKLQCKKRGLKGRLAPLGARLDTSHHSGIVVKKRGSKHCKQLQVITVDDDEVHRPQKIDETDLNHLSLSQSNTPLLLGAGRRHDHTRHPQHPPPPLSSITVATSRSRCSSRRPRFPPVPAASPQPREGGGTSKAHNTT